MLGQLASLARLHLEGNDIRDDGAPGNLSAGLGRCTSLVHLNLRSNAIEDEGAKSFAGVLGQCVSLTHVDL